MSKEYYYNMLYPVQDKVLIIISTLETGFYLSGGTASSRGYLHHRFSDDLDLFVNDNNNFGLWSDRVINALSGVGNWRVDVMLRDDRFTRVALIEGVVLLKIEMINDVPSHIGRIRKHEILGMLDSPENILANKVTAIIDRQEPKDMADIFGFFFNIWLPLSAAITDAHSKAAGIFPPDLARILCSAAKEDWEVVRWAEPPPLETYLKELQRLGDSLIIIEG